MKTTIRRAAALKTLQELAGFSGGGADLLSATTRALGDLVPLDGGALMPTSPDGDCVGFFGDDLFTQENARTYFTRFYESPLEELMAPTSQQLMRSGAGLHTSRQNGPGWRSTELYQHVFRAARAEHVVRLFLRRGSRPLAVLMLARSSGSDFTPAECAQLLEVRDTLQAVVEKALRPLDGVETTKDDEGTWVVNLTGEILLNSVHAERLAQMAFGAQTFIPGRGGEFQAWLKRMFDGLARRARLGEPALLELTSVYGFFQVEAVAVEGPSRADRCMVVRLSRFVPVKSRLFHSPAFRSLPLREKQTLLQLVEGASTSEVAQTLGVATSTALTWVRSLYSRFGVARRSELVAALLEDARRATLGLPPEWNRGNDA